MNQNRKEADGIKFRIKVCGTEVLSMEEYLEKRQALTAQQKRTKKLRPEKMTEDTVIELAQLMYM